MAESSTTITPESRKDLPKRSRGKKTLMLDAIRAACGTEAEFLEDVVKLSIGSPPIKADPDDDDSEDIPGVPANPQLLTLVLNRIEPPLKATMPLIEFEFNADAKPHEQASQVIDAVSNGVMSPDIGSMFISSIKSMLEIEEYTELKNRIDKLEAVLNGDAG